MLKKVRSARGTIVDFQLMAIKAQLAARPAPAPVIQRKLTIEERDGVKSSVAVTATPTEIISPPKQK